MVDSNSKPRRAWPFLVAALAIVLAILVVVLGKACPPVPAPAGKPASTTGPAVEVNVAPAPVAPVVDAKVVAPATTPTQIVVEVPAAKGGPK